MSLWERFYTWLFDYWIDIVLVVFILTVIAFCVLGVIANGKVRQQFMEDCLKERKQYECTAMWRQGDSQIVPVPIVIPSR
jgi:hypothetical protein